MTTDHETWDPRSTVVLENQVAAYDELRARCPVAHDGSGAWTLFRHAEVLRLALDHATFSSDVSSHLQVPNGMDPPAHTPYRNEFRLGRPGPDNLVYGAGVHVCPGAPLARLELRVLVEELLAATSRIEPWPDEPPTRAAFPAGGFTDLSVRLTAAPAPMPGTVPAPAHRGADHD